MAKLGTFEKYIFILKEFEKRQDKELDPYDGKLKEELGLDARQLKRLLNEICDTVDSITKIQKGSKNVFKQITPLDIFTEVFKNSHEMGWLFHMAQEADPEIFKKLESYTNTNNHIYKFRNTPFEDVATLESKEVFTKLRLAVEAREYRDISFFEGRDKGKTYEDVKCLKLVLVDNNWYVAFAYFDQEKNEKISFGRISFIKSVEYTKTTNAYQPYSVQKYMEFLDTIQNSMTLYGATKKTATIRATPNVAHYFVEGMKPFLLSQKFDRQEEDGSILFTLEYTQPLEILPFIQRWLPDLEVLEPQELRDAYKQKLQDALKLYA